MTKAVNIDEYVFRQARQFLARGNSRPPSMARGILGWLILIGAAIGLANGLRSKGTAGTATAQPIQDVHRTDALTTIAYVTIALSFVSIVFIWFFVFRRLRIRAGFDSNFTFDVSKDALVLEGSNIRLEVPWSAFSKFVESPSQLILLQHNRMLRAIPKTAFRSEEELEAFRLAIVANIAADDGE